MDENSEKRQQTGRPALLWLSVAVVAFIFLLGAAFAGGLLVRRALVGTPEDVAGGASASQIQSGSADNRHTSPKVGSPAPNFTLNDLDGNPVSLADYRGQPVLINFWATWCAPCEAEMPEINEAYLAHRDEGLVVLAVDLEEHPDTIRSFVDYYQLAFTILVDREGTVGDQYETQGLPMSFFVDRAGIIAHIHIGQMLEKDIAAGLAKIR